MDVFSERCKVVPLFSLLDKKAILHTLQTGRRRQYWERQISKSYFTLNLRSRAVLNFLKKKKSAKHREIHNYLVSKGWAGFKWTSRPLEKLLVFGLVIQEKRRGQYAITKAGERLDLFRAYYPIEAVNLFWLKHFIVYTW